MGFTEAYEGERRKGWSEGLFVLLRGFLIEAADPSRCLLGVNTEKGWARALPPVFLIPQHVCIDAGTSLVDLLASDVRGMRVP